jgi:opacity protein-like surface antigen
MKKIQFLIALLCALFIAVSAQAKTSSATKSNKNRFYIGADVTRSHTSHTQYDREYSGDPDVNGIKSHGKKKIGFGLNAGYRANFGHAFIAPEIFYDYLKNKAPDFSNTTAPTSDSMTVSSRYGAKINLGYNLISGYKFISKLDVFVSAGMANVNYSFKGVYGADSYKDSGSELAPIYGVGLIYSINDNWGIRTSYDRQRFIVPYYRVLNAAQIDHIKLDVFKAGLIYNF